MACVIVQRVFTHKIRKERHQIKPYDAAVGWRGIAVCFCRDRSRESSSLPPADIVSICSLNFYFFVKFYLISSYFPPIMEAIMVEAYLLWLDQKQVKDQLLAAGLMLIHYFWSALTYIFSHQSQSNRNRVSTVHSTGRLPSCTCVIFLVPPCHI